MFSLDARVRVDTAANREVKRVKGKVRDLGERYFQHLFITVSTFLLARREYTTPKLENIIVLECRTFAR